MLTKKTARGKFFPDQSGLYHYKSDSLGTVELATADAVDHRPNGCAAWFWFNGTPAPIFLTDSAQDLAKRWRSWRRDYQESPRTLLDMLQQMTEVGEEMASALS